MIVIFLGPPGSGKGTQSFFISQALSVPHLSTGDMLRDEVRKETILGDEIRSVMSSGGLVSEDVVNNLVLSKLNSQACMNGCVLDGYPRTISQAKFLFEVARDTKFVVFYFNISDEIAIKRIMGRYSCKSCGAIYHEEFTVPKVLGICDKCGSTEFIQRLDDNLITVANRLVTYHKQTEELLQFFRDNNNLFKIDASRSMWEVRNDAIEILKRC